MEFARVLKETRQRMGLTQEAMAKRLGVARASLSLYEAGKQTPDLNFLDALHRESGAPLDYLMGYSDNHTAQTIGIDKEVGLSTESLERLAVMSDTERKVINALITAPEYPFWALTAARAAGRFYFLDNQPSAPAQAVSLHTIVPLYERQLGEMTCIALSSSEMLKKDEIWQEGYLDAMRFIADIVEQAQQSEKESIAKAVVSNEFLTILESYLQKRKETSNAEEEPHRQNKE